MKNYYFFDQDCIVCAGSGGRLFVVEDISNGRLLLNCEECEMGYLDPGNLKASEGFLTLNEDYEARLADLETVTRYGWQKYALELIPEDRVPKHMRYGLD